MAGTANFELLPTDYNRVQLKGYVRKIKLKEESHQSIEDKYSNFSLNGEIVSPVGIVEEPQDPELKKRMELVSRLEEKINAIIPDYSIVENVVNRAIKIKNVWKENCLTNSQLMIANLNKPLPVEEDEGITITVNGSNISDDDRHIYKDLSKPIAKNKREQPLESLVKDFSKPMPKKKKVGSVEEKKKVNYAFEVVYAVGTKTLTTQQYDGLIINDREIIIIHDGEENTVQLDTKKIKSLVIECIPALLKMQEEVKEKELKPARKSTRNQIEIKYKEHDIFLNGNILDDPYHAVYTSFENELKNILNYF